MTRRPAPAADRPATYRQVFASRDFRYLLAGHLVTLLGDQVLRVALILLVYRDTGSPLLTAFGAALTFLPWVFAGPLLSGFADRLPRRSLLLLGTLGRGAVVALMAVPGLPLGVVLTLVFVAELLAPPMNAASFSILPEMLDGDRYVVGSSLVQSVGQLAQFAGLGLGGLLAASIGARGSFLVDAGSFVLSALLFRLALRHPYPPAASTRSPFWSDFRDGVRVSLGRPGPRNLLLIAWWGVAVIFVPDALAAPYVVKVTHGGSQAIGWMLAANSVGMVLGLTAIGRVGPARRSRLLQPMAFGATLPLLLFALRPPLAVGIGALAVSGFLFSCQSPLQAAFAREIPAEYRGRAFGVAAAGIEVFQGLGMIGGGGLAQLFGVTPAITIAGVVGAVGMLLLWRQPLPVPAVPAPAAATVST